LPRHTMK